MHIPNCSTTLLPYAALALLLLASLRLPAQEEEPMHQMILHDHLFYSYPAKVLNLPQVRRMVQPPPADPGPPPQGLVIVEVRVDTAGMLQGHEVIRSPHPALSQAVEEQLHHLRFEPATADGSPRPSSLSLSFMVLQDTTSQDSHGNTLHHCQIDLAVESHLAKADVCKATYTAHADGLLSATEEMAIQGLPGTDEVSATVLLRLQVSPTGSTQLLANGGTASTQLQEAVWSHLHTLQWTPAVECGQRVSSEVNLTLTFTR